MTVIKRLVAGVSALAAGGRPREAAALRTIGRLGLGGNKSVAILEFEGMRFLVGCGADTVSFIHTIPAASTLGVDSPGPHTAGNGVGA
jgi:flagellar biogenesis protein FliO